MATAIDFGIAWEWEHDEGFIGVLERVCAARGLTTCVVSPANLRSVEAGIAAGELSFDAFFDRASDTDPSFLPLASAVARAGGVFVNRPCDVERAINKAAMHIDFSSRGIDVPYTIILPRFEEGDPTGEILRLDNVGTPFIVKPAHGGGGLGVLLGARTLAEVVAARKEFGHDQILIQENIVPRLLGGRKAWFRAYYVGGETPLCWWDPEIHVYERVTPAEAAEWGLGRMEAIARLIHDISRLNFFSTEIAVTGEMRYVSVDYVNDQCDMRLKSKTHDGVPDDVVESVCASLAGFVARARAQRRQAGAAACPPCPPRAG
jgi:hypothetical protein